MSRTVDDVYPPSSDFITKEELGDEAYVLEIAGAEIVTLDDKQRIQLSFTKTEKQLTLNATNARTIAKIHGQSIDSWTGKKVELYVDPTVQYAGKMVGGIKVRPADGWGKSHPAPSEREAGDDLPF